MKLHPKDKENNNNVNEAYKKLPDSVKGLLSDILVRKANNLLLEIDDCESPIEQMLGIAMNEYLFQMINPLADDFFIVNQEVIECKNKKYRVDFLLAVIRKGNLHDFVIECDGHDFHEKTKDQAKRDKRRDRDLMSKGYRVIRFSGSEIYNNPIICAREIGHLVKRSLLNGDQQ